MTSAYLNQFHLQTGNSDQEQNHIPSPSSLAQRSSSFTHPLHFSSADVQGHVLCHGHPYEHNGVVLIDSGPDNIALYSATTKSNNNSEITKQPSNNGHRREYADGSLKWMPSKIRWMKKLMLAPDHKVTASGARGIFQSTQVRQLPSQDSSSGGAYNTTTTSPADAIRVCSDCNTTRTPLWRSGPQGPKSLCNACGIRQRKARRAMAAAAAAAGGGAIQNAEMPGKVQNEKLSELGNCLLPFKKRCKITNKETAQKKLKFNDDKNIISLSNGSSVHRVLPQDERDAAILLMALSCGIMYG